MPPKRKPGKIPLRVEVLKMLDLGKEKAEDTTSSIPADFFENEEYDDFQVPIGLHQPSSISSTKQRDIEEATRLSLQTIHASVSGMSQEFDRTLSLTPSTPSEFTSTLVHLSDKVRMRKLRSEAKIKARQESSTSKPSKSLIIAAKETEEREPIIRRETFVI
ncbi:hypothetical protein BDB01DRAFT_895271 [Pilobolus umbonatus]|nr:hypothetical protein BDB01DRAFT_895271 [Pilobolus umbonatus]